MKKRSGIVGVILAMMVLIGTVAHICSTNINISEKDATYLVEVDRPWVG